MRPIMHFTVGKSASGFYQTDNQGRLNFTQGMYIAAPAQQPQAIAVVAAPAVFAAPAPPVMPAAPAQQTQAIAVIAAPAPPVVPAAAVAAPAAAPSFGGVLPFLVPRASRSARLKTFPKADAVMQRAVAAAVLTALTGAEVQAAHMEAAAEMAAKAATAVLLDAEPTEGGGFLQHTLDAANAAAHVAAAASDAAATASALGSKDKTAAGQYLESLGLGRYQSAFYADEIFEMRQLLALDKEDLLMRLNMKLGPANDLLVALDQERVKGSV